MNKFVIFTLLISGLGCSLFSEPCLAQNELSYQGYSISKVANPKTNISTAVIKKGRKILARHSDGFGKDLATQFDLLPILGTKDKQLIVTQLTGGAHCCRKYWVYDLKPTFQLIFQSSDFNIGDGGDSEEGKFQNLDNDKELELVDRNDSFLYFDDLAYVSSPRPILVFDYSHKTGKFELSNKKFDSYILKDLDLWKKRVVDEKEANSSQFGTDVFSIFIDYVYAGREKEGYKYYYRNRDILVSGWLHSETKVRKILNRDRAYRFIYKK